MDTQEKITSGFQKILSVFGNIAGLSTLSSSYKQRYQKLINEEIDMPVEETLSSSYEQGYQKLINEEIDMPMEKVNTSSNLTPANSFGRGVPKGHLPVYVGPERKRFVIRIDDLNHALFRPLLDVSGEAIGTETIGQLTLECEPSFFEDLLQVIDSTRQAPKN